MAKAQAPTELHATWRANAGTVRLEPIVDHRINVHATESTPSLCLDSDFRSVRIHDDVDITPAGETGGFAAETASQTFEVRISPTLVARIAEETERRVPRVGARHVVRDGRLAHLAWALEAELRAPAPAGPLFVDAIGVAMAIELLGAVPVAAPDVTARKLQRVIDFIEANLGSSLSLAELARVAGTSSAYLRQSFKTATGTSVHRYVVRRRVERARVLLLQRALPASEIALLVGFAHQTHMARWMRRELGVAPRSLSARGGGR